MKALFIGFGNMASAIHETLLSNSPITEIHVITQKSKPKVTNLYHDIGKVKCNFDIIFLGFKPYHLNDIQIPPDLYHQGTHFISLLASKSRLDIAQHFSVSVSSVTRFMPNLMVAGGNGFVGILTETQNHSLMEQICKNMGRVYFCKTEDEIAEITVLAGSMPGFLYFTLSKLKDAINEQFPHLPFGQDGSFESLISASLEYANSSMSGKSYKNLYEDVASKGGVTEAGANYLSQSEIQRAFELMLNSALTKSKG